MCRAHTPARASVLCMCPEWVCVCMLTENYVPLNLFYFLLVKKKNRRILLSTNACNLARFAVCSTQIKNFFQSTIKMSIKFKMVELRRCSPKPDLPLPLLPSGCTHQHVPDSNAGITKSIFTLK